MTTEIIPLFSTPIYISNTKIYFFEKEIEFLQKLEFYKSIHNNLSKNINLFDFLEFGNVKHICETHLKTYVNQILDCNQEFYITNSWATKNSKGDSHHVHDHPNSIFSGVLYLQIPDPENSIKFHHKSSLKNNFNFFYNINKYNTFNSDTWVLPIKQGEIIIFPSWLHHSVAENQSNDDRYVVGFNTFVKGKFGKDIYSGDLNLDTSPICNYI